MDQCLRVIQDNGIWIVGVLQLLVLVVLALLIHKINMISRKTDRITKKVENYLKVILEEETEKETNIPAPDMGVNSRGKMDEETQTRIISSVLQEIFP